MGSGCAYSTITVIRTIKHSKTSPVPASTETAIVMRLG